MEEAGWSRLMRLTAAPPRPPAARERHAASSSSLVSKAFWPAQGFGHMGKKGGVVRDNLPIALEWLPGPRLSPMVQARGPLRRIATCAALLVALCVAAPPGAIPARAASPTFYYLSLGDSLAYGLDVQQLMNELSA